MDFSAPYNRDQYVAFFRNQFLPDDYEATDESIAVSFSTQYTQQVTKIGRSSLLDINVYEVQHGSENDPRVSLSRESFRLLAEYGQKRALVLFISKTSRNYRLSLVTLDLKWEEGKKLTSQYSNPKRFSFFLGPDAKTHTPQEYLVKPGRVKDFEDLKKRFSIEVVNKDFYTEIAVLFTKLTGGKRKVGSTTRDFGDGTLGFPSTDDTKRKEFAVRLIGRLVFCWFLKKKKSQAGLSLLPAPLLSIEAVNNKGMGGFYHSTLEPLFFEVLNTPIEDRASQFRSQPWILIPFLNGGLFTPHEDYYKLTFNHVSEHLNDLLVPDDWLKELFKVFDTYNFTIDENTPVDIELSIEPEMLGRIFENLLAEINPETGETARKSTGSYYTPRPIVEYMVEESLKHYLSTKTSLPEEKVVAILSYNSEDIGLTDSQRDSVIDALGCIRIIDPACGSGAFPMGILQKILLVLQKLDPDSKKWLDKLLSGVPDPMYQKELKTKIDQPNYLHKLGIIRDCIFGVDVQPIAVEISKLRCFLSLIVDEKVDDSKPNRGVEHLPNLEFKFVCADSLVGLGSSRLPTSEAMELRDKLRQLRSEYLISYGDEKKRLEQKFRTIQSEMRRASLDWGKGSIETLKLADWRPFEEEPCGWFDPQWMFGDDKGFDIAIANPPYGISVKGTYRTSVLDNLGKVPDYEVYYFFIELAHKLLLAGGVMAYIVPNTLLFNVFAADYRLMFLDKWRIDEILDCTDFVFFEKATVRNAILRLIKAANEVRIGYRNTANTRDFSELVSRPRLNIDKKYLTVNNKNWGLVFKLDSKILQLIARIQGNKIQTLDYFPEMSQGLIAYDRYKGQSSEVIASRAYHYSEKVRKDLKPWLWGRDVTRYNVEWNGQEYIDYCDGIANPREPKFFKGERVLIREITNPSIYAGFTDKELYHDPSIIVVLPGKVIDIRALLGILNSKLATFFHFNSSPKATKGAFPKILVEDIKRFPLAECSSDSRPVYDSLATSVGQILVVINDGRSSEDSAKQQEMAKLDETIDHQVYRLYSLTDEEIAIVEGRSN